MKYINIFKNDKTSENQPDYRMTVSEKLADGTYKSKEVGACWLKPMKSGGQYLSCQLKDAREHEGIMYPAFRLVEENGGVPVKTNEKREAEHPADDIPF